MAKGSYTSVIQNIFARRDRKEEFAQAQQLERRRVSVSERRQTQAESMASITEKYQEAQTKYMTAMADRMMDDELQQKKMKLENERLMLDKNAYRDQKKQIKSLRKGMKSDDPVTAELARNTYWGAKTINQNHDMIDALRLRLQIGEAERKAILDQAKLKIDQQNSLLTGFKFATEFGPILEKNVGKESFEAGYKMMSELLGFKESGGGGESRPVGTGKTATTSQFPGISTSTPAPQMTLEQAVEALKGGTISSEDLLSAWPSLEGVIDKSLLAPPEGAGASATPTPANGSFELDLIKRLQQ